MPLTVRLDDKLQTELRIRAERAGVSVSDYVREAIAEKLGREPGASPYELGQHLFGKYASGVPDLGTNHRRHFRDKLRAKRRS